MASFDLQLPIDSESDAQALYKALLRARASEHSEVVRNSRLSSTGYGQGTYEGRLDNEAADALLREGLLTMLIIACQSEFERFGWDWK